MDPEILDTAPETPAPAPAEVVTPSPTPPTFDAETGKEVEADPAPAPSTDEEAQPRDEQGRFQKRVNELTRKNGETARERDYWRAQALSSNATAPSQASVPDATSQKPTPDQFSSYEDFIEAMTGWKAEKIVREDREQSRQAEQAKALATTWQQREAEFRKVAADYEDVVGNSEITLPNHVLDELQKSDVGPQLAYHLAKHPEIAEKMQGLSERAAMRELGRLEAAMTSASAPAPAPAARTSSAPPPVKPVSQSSAGVPTLDKMSMDEYVKQRKSQGAGWAR